MALFPHFVRFAPKRQCSNSVTAIFVLNENKDIEKVVLQINNTYVHIFTNILKFVLFAIDLFRWKESFRDKVEYIHFLYTPMMHLLFFSFFWFFWFFFLTHQWCIKFVFCFGWLFFLSFGGFGGVGVYLFWIFLYLKNSDSAGVKK